MKWSRACRVDLIVLGMLVSCASQPGLPTSATGGFQEYWLAFREAVLAKDSERIASRTEFPFKTRGTLDGDAEQSHDRAAFLKILDQLLRQDSGLNREPETMRQLIERTGTVPDKDFGDGGATVRIGTFVFRRTGANWRFTQAYVEE